MDHFSAKDVGRLSDPIFKLNFPMEGNTIGKFHSLATGNEVYDILNTNQFIKWKAHYSKYLHDLYDIFIDKSVDLNLPFNTINFNLFCKFLFKNSDKYISVWI